MRRPLTLALLALTACDDPGDDPRTALLVGTIAEQDQRWLERDPDALAGKLRKMATRPFDFLRGSASLYWRDVVAGTPVDTDTAFGGGDAAWCWIVGDPHLENLGTFRAGDGTMHVDWNDYDAATVGPWWDDLRRLAVSLVLAADELELEPGRDRGLIEAAVRAYAEEMARLAAGQGRRLEVGTSGDVIEALVADARAHGDHGDTLATYTRRTTDGGRVVFVGEVEPPRSDGVWVDTTIAVTGDEQATVAAALAAWRPATAAQDSAGTLLGVSRRLGAGVASYPAPRYYALLSGPTSAPDDDLLLELKETLDPPPLAALVPPGLVDPVSAGARVVAAQHLLGARADADPWLGAATLPPRSFRVRERTGYQRGLDLAAIPHEPAAALAVATVAGRLLAAAHGAAPTPGSDGGRPAALRIAPLLDGRVDTLVAETTRFAIDYAALTRADAGRLADALDRAGPLLGLAPTATWGER